MKLSQRLQERSPSPAGATFEKKTIDLGQSFLLNELVPIKVPPAKSKTTVSLSLLKHLGKCVFEWNETIRFVCVKVKLSRREKESLKHL